MNYCFIYFLALIGYGEHFCTNLERDRFKINLSVCSAFTERLSWSCRDAGTIKGQGGKSSKARWLPKECIQIVKGT